MTDPTPYTPPKVRAPPANASGRFANINRPVAGPTHDKELPAGKHPLQLYSLGTPNGVKVRWFTTPEAPDTEELVRGVGAGAASSAPITADGGADGFLFA